tara:strand:- start:448 stop:1683 length:1236 start_codon:yes stop_codon:yes gene_type:complete
MAINITYEKTGLGEFLERLPSLLLEYQKTKWSMEQEEKIRKDDREYKAAVSMYSDAKELYKSSRQQLDVLEKEYLKTGLNMDSLNETYKTAGIDLIDTIYKGEMTNWEGRANHYGKLTEIIGAKVNEIEGILYNDVAQAKQIMLGGGIMGSGAGDPNKWDREDLGVDAYIQTFGEPSQATRDYFAANPGTITTQLQKLEGTRLLNTTRDTNLVIKTQKNSEQFLGRYTVSAAGTSQLNDFYNMEEIKHGYNSKTPGIDLPMYENAIKAQNNIQVNIALEFSELLGEEVDGQAFPLKYFEAYEQMHLASKPSVETGAGEQGLRDFAPLVQNALKSYSYYVDLINNGETAKAKRIELLAQKYYGFSAMSFQQYVTSLNDHFSQYTLIPFTMENKVISHDESIFDNDIYDEEDK